MPYMIANLAFTHRAHSRRTQFKELILKRNMTVLITGGESCTDTDPNSWKLIPVREWIDAAASKNKNLLLE